MLIVICWWWPQLQMGRKRNFYRAYCTVTCSTVLYSGTVCHWHCALGVWVHQSQNERCTGNIQWYSSTCPTLLGDIAIPRVFFFSHLVARRLPSKNYSTEAVEGVIPRVSALGLYCRGDVKFYKGLLSEDCLSQDIWSYIRSASINACFAHS